MSAPKWRLNLRTTLAQKRWDQELVVFSSQSGDTHLLDFVSGEGLSCFERGGLDRDELCTRLAARLDIDPDQLLLDYVDQLIVRFEALGLIESVDCCE